MVVEIYAVFFGVRVVRLLRVLLVEGLLQRVFVVDDARAVGPDV